MAIVGVFGGLMYGIHLDYQERKKQDVFNRQEWDRRWSRDEKLRDCWIMWQSTGLVEKDCMPQ